MARLLAYSRSLCESLPAWERGLRHAVSLARWTRRALTRCLDLAQRPFARPAAARMIRITRS